MIVVFTGTAGSGKTLLTRAYGEWLARNGYKVAILNLDPGVKKLPYTPKLDIREYFTIDRIMVEEGVGPNTAFIKASKMSVEKVDEMLNRIDLEEYDYLLVDTPGQMEIFVFHSSGPTIMEKFRSLDETICIYLIDGEFVKNPLDLITSYFMSILVQLRLLVPTIPIINKSDLLKLANTAFKSEDYVGLLRGLEVKIKGLASDLALEILDTILKTTSSIRIVKVSAVKMWGLEDLHSIIYEVKCACGDLT